MSDSNDDGGQTDSNQQWQKDIALALGVSVVAAVATGLASLALGHISGGEAKQLLEAVMPTSRFLCSAVMTSSATILALMLTLIGMTISADVKVSDLFYKRLKQIAFYDLLVPVLAVVFLLMHTIPITKSDELPEWWFPAVYYSLVGISTILGGALIGIVTMLYTAIREVIEYVGIGCDDHRLATDADDTCSDGD